MANHQIIHMDDIDSISTLLLTAFVIMKRGHARNQHVADLILARPAHHTRIAAHALRIVMPGMIMTDGDDGGMNLAQRVALLRSKRVGNQGNILATQLETGVAKPEYFHYYVSLLLYNKFGRGLQSSPEPYCTTGSTLLQVDSHPGWYTLMYTYNFRSLY